MTSPEILAIVTEVYQGHDLLDPTWSGIERREFLEREAARLSRQIAELAADLGEQAVQSWISRTGGHPDFPTKVGLLNSATAQAKEIVLGQQVYELIPPPAQREASPGPPKPEAGEVAWDRRWTQTRHRSDPSEDQEELIARVWPDPLFSALFRIKAGYLIAARAEDRLPLPTSGGDPLADQLAAMVYADLRADGLPER